MYSVNYKYIWRYEDIQNENEKHACKKHSYNSVHLHDSRFKEQHYDS